MRLPIVALLLVTSSVSLLASCKKGDDASDEDEATTKRRRERREKAKRRQEVYAEATRILGSIEAGSKSMFQRETDTSDAGTGPFVHAFCASSKVPVPSTVPKGKAVVVDPKEWEAETWKCLRLFVPTPMECQYAYESSGQGTGARYTATAVCDPEGTGEAATFVLEGKGTEFGDAARVKLTSPPDA